MLLYVWDVCNSRYKLGKLHWTSHCRNIQVQIYKTTIPLISHSILIKEHIRHCILGRKHWCQSFKSEKPGMNVWVLLHVWQKITIPPFYVQMMFLFVAMNELRKLLMCIVARYCSLVWWHTTADWWLFFADKIVSSVWKMTKIKLMLKTKQRQFIVKPGNGRIRQNMS